MTIRRFDEGEREVALADLPEWDYDEKRGAIQRRLQFEDFPAAWSFMNHVALLAEKADHHPEWSNVWNRVDIVLTTHDAGGLSARDIALARQIDAIVD